MKKLFRGHLLRPLEGLHRQQRGQILILASILLMLSGIMVVPLAHYMNTGIKTTQVYQRNTKEIYAADRGVQYGMWRAKYDSTISADRANGIYSSYGPYTLPSISPNDHNSVTAQLSANWLFYYLFRLPMGATPHNVNLIVTCIANSGVFTIEFSNTQQPNGPPVQPTVIDKMGVWLPPGFTYTGSPGGITTAAPAITNVYGGTNLTWNNVSYGLGKYASATEHFNYTPSSCTPKGAASWVFPQQQSIGASWDNAIWWYDLYSTAIDTSVTPNKTTSVHAVVIFDPGTSSGLNLITYVLSP